jgi:hypothetical protein
MTPDSSKSTYDKATENISGMADKGMGAMQPSTIILQAYRLDPLLTCSHRLREVDHPEDV